jgi:hypothetical protein
VVTVARAGRWSTPGHEPPPLGRTRRGADWEVASTSSDSGWAVELRFRAPAPGALPPRIALRTYNDRPQGWWSWPAPPESTRATRVERTPNLWVPLEPVVPQTTPRKRS